VPPKRFHGANMSGPTLIAEFYARTPPPVRARLPGHPLPFNATDLVRRRKGFSHGVSGTRAPSSEEKSGWVGASWRFLGYGGHSRCRAWVSQRGLVWRHGKSQLALPQSVVFQLPHKDVRLDAQLLAQQPPEPAMGSPQVRLTAVPVQSDNQARPQSLPETGTLQARPPTRPPTPRADPTPYWRPPEYFIRR
jgi:hypothetical protein